MHRIGLGETDQYHGHRARRMSLPWFHLYWGTLSTKCTSAVCRTFHRCEPASVMWLSQSVRTCWIKCGLKLKTVLTFFMPSVDHMLIRVFTELLTQIHYLLCSSWCPMVLKLILSSHSVVRKGGGLTGTPYNTYVQTKEIIFCVNYFTALTVFSHVWSVTIDGVWIDDRIYWTLTDRNYK
jgi:hypothetical protein